MPAAWSHLLRAMPAQCRDELHRLWPVGPPPEALTWTSNAFVVLVTSKGLSTVNCRGAVGKYSSNGRPFTSIFPEPGEIRTWATEVLRRPVAENVSAIKCLFLMLWIKRPESVVVLRAGAVHRDRPSA